MSYSICSDQIMPCFVSSVRAEVCGAGRGIGRESDVATETIVQSVAATQGDEQQGPETDRGLVSS